MARRTTRGARPAAAARQPRAKSRKAPVGEIEVVEDAEGMGIDGGIVIATSVLLVLAILFTDALCGKLGGGVFL